MAVDNQSEISFSIPQRTLPWQPIFLVLSTEVMHVTGRTTNVGLCPALKTVLLRTLKGARL